MKRRVTKHDIAEFLDAVFDELLTARAARAASGAGPSMRGRIRARHCAHVRRHRR